MLANRNLLVGSFPLDLEVLVVIGEHGSEGESTPVDPA
jgi:hypothetical protein